MPLRFLQEVSAGNYQADGVVSWFASSWMQNYKKQQTIWLNEFKLTRVDYSSS